MVVSGDLQSDVGGERNTTKDCQERWAYSLVILEFGVLEQPKRKMVVVFVVFHFFSFFFLTHSNV